MEGVEVELDMDKYNREIDQKRKEIQEVKLLSSGGEESLDEDEPHAQIDRIPKRRIEYQPPSREHEIEELVDTNARQLEYDSFIFNDEFIYSPEFKSFLYKYKGKEVKESVENVTPNNEK